MSNIKIERGVFEGKELSPCSGCMILELDIPKPCFTEVEKAMTKLVILDDKEMMAWGKVIVVGEGVESDILMDDIVFWLKADMEYFHNVVRLDEKSYIFLPQQYVQYMYRGDK